MKSTGEIYRFIFPLLLAAIFSMSLYIFQIIPPGYRNIAYNYSILALVGLFLVIIIFMVRSHFKAGELLFNARPGKNNKVFLILGLMFLIFGAGFGGFELYGGEFVHGDYPAGPVILLAAVGSLLGWRLTTAIFDNGIRPSCRNFIPWEQIKSFGWLDEVYLYTDLLLPPGGLISFDAAGTDCPEIFKHLLQKLPLQQEERKINPSGKKLNSCGMIGYYLSVLEEGEYVEMIQSGGVEVLLNSNNGEKHNQQWEKINFDEFQKLFSVFAEDLQTGDDFKEVEIKYRRRETGTDKNVVSCLVNFNLDLKEDKLQLFLKRVQN